MVYCGIDPGKDGAIVFIYGEKENEIDINTIPLINKEIDLRALRDIFQMWPSEQLIVAIENVHGIPGASAQATFQFGRVCGFLEGIIEALGIRYTKVNPKKWQKIMHEGVNQTGEIKAMSYQAVRRLYPSIDVRKSTRAVNFHSGIVDALCIATWCKMTYK